jgi:hypothetical protein
MVVPVSNYVFFEWWSRWQYDSSKNTSGRIGKPRVLRLLTRLFKYVFLYCTFADVSCKMLRRLPFPYLNSISFRFLLIVDRDPPYSEPSRWSFTALVVAAVPSALLFATNSRTSRRCSHEMTFFGLPMGVERLGISCLLYNLATSVVLPIPVNSWSSFRGDEWVDKRAAEISSIKDR